MQLTKNFNKSEFESKDGAEMPKHVFLNIPGNGFLLC